MFCGEFPKLGKIDKLTVKQWQNDQSVNGKAQHNGREVQSEAAEGIGQIAHFQNLSGNQKHDSDRSQHDDPLRDPHDDDRDGGEKLEDGVGLLAHNGDGHAEE